MSHLSTAARWRQQQADWAAGMAALLADRLGARPENLGGPGHRRRPVRGDRGMAGAPRSAHLGALIDRRSTASWPAPCRSRRPEAAIGRPFSLIGLAFSGEAAHGATTLAFVVLWLAGGIFAPEPDARRPGGRPPGAALLGVVQVGKSVAAGRSPSAPALVVLAAWTVGAGGLAALAWRRVLAR